MYTHMTLPHLLLIPGFGLGPEDYAAFVASVRAEVVAVDPWPRTAEEVLRIGPPGTDSFQAWMDTKAAEVAEVMRSHPDVAAVFAHSAGYMLADRVAGTKPIIAFGFQEKLSRGRSRVTHIHGRHDTQVPCTAARVLECGHFGCVSAAAAERCRQLQLAIGGQPNAEPHVDAAAELAAEVEACMRACA